MECGKAKYPMALRSPVCDKAPLHEGRHHFDVTGPWGVRNDRGQYVRQSKEQP